MNATRGAPPALPELNSDFRDMLVELTRAGAAYVVVGGYAVSSYGYLRTTKDIDIFVEPSQSNAPRVLLALSRFGAPMHDLVVADLVKPGTIFQIGVPPRRIDILTAIEGVAWADAVREKSEADFGGLIMPVIGLHALLRNKRAVGRPEDKRDVKELERIHGLARVRPTRPPGAKKKARARRRRQT